MRRREFIALASAVSATVALARFALAQQAPKVWRIAVLTSGITDTQRQAIFDGLADYGYIDDKSITLEFFTAPAVADLPAYAARAIASKPDLIITGTSPPPLAVKPLTLTIPVVMTVIQDPVAIGAVASYGHPGGNLTGFMQGGPQFAGNQIALIHEVLPNVSRVALMGVPVDPAYAVMLPQYLVAAKVLNLDTIVFEVRDGDDLALAFDHVSMSGAQAIQIMPAGIYLGVNSAIVAKLAIERRLALFADTAVNGALLGYGANNVDVTRRAMSYVDAIFKGAKPADLPIQQPTMFDLVINTTTAKALGTTFPQPVLLRATRVIG